VANRFQHLIPPGQGGQAKPQNRFAHLIPKGDPLSPKSNRELSMGETAMDVAKSGAVGVAEGTIGLAGLPGDLRTLAKRGVEYIAGEDAANRFEKSPGQMMAGPGGALMRLIERAPTSQQIKAPIEEVTGEFYEPKTTAGEYAKTTGEFAPAVLAGPGGAIRKTAMTVIPSTASEMAGQVARKSAPEHEGKARFVAAVLSGAPLAGSKKNLAKEISKTAPSHEAVKQQTKVLYGKLKDAGIKYNSRSFDQMATDLARKLTSDGFRAAQAPMAADALKAVGENIGKSLEYADFESLRKIASKIVREKNATDTDKAAAGIIIDALDEFAGKASYISNGSVKDAPALMKEAREMAKRNIIGKQIEDMFSKAETYQSGFESGLRNQFSNYLRSNKAKGLSHAERQAFMDVAKGNFTSNTLGTFGKLGVDFGKLGNRAALLPAAGAAAGYAADSLLTGGATVAAATGAKYAARKMTRSAADRAKSTVLAGREAQKKALENRQKQIAETLIRRLIVGDNASRTLAPRPVE
jgi:hypothetical protein